MQPIAAFIFDMDGVLVDSEPLHLEAANAVLAREGAFLDEVENRPFLGTNERAYWTALKERFGLAEDVDHYVRVRHEEVLRRLEARLPVMPGVGDFVRAAAAAGLGLAVASSSERALVDRVVAAVGVEALIGVRASGDEVTRPKPDPEIFRLAAGRLGVPAASCLVFEDSLNGVSAALRAGMRVVRVITRTTREIDFPPVSLEIDSFVGLDVDEVREAAMREEGARP